MTIDNHVKLEDLKAGDKIVADNGFTCLAAGSHIVREVEDKDGKPSLAVQCADGWHWLDGQKDPDGYLTGFLRGEDREVLE
jgi:hypothetical protein